MTTMTAVLAFLAGGLIAGWISDLRRDRDFWHRQYQASEQTRRELTDALLDRGAA